ncbi:MAG: TonB-dependent receptor plug domain-containing protein, partial [Prevotella sp.]|nr:TonB-dependent receptor plug domain-containing protein [Prevotella sp.]
MKKAFIVGIVLGYAAIASATIPEDSKSTESDSLKSISLQDVNVVSTRAGKSTPMAFQNFSKDDLKGVNFGKDIPTLLQLTPSVLSTSDAGTGIGYTGIRVRGTDPTRINVTANGIPVNDAESGLVYWSNIPDFASSVENIQIQRGVGTSTNGAGAFGATVNMQTENIGLKPYASIDMSGGSYYTHKESFRFGTGLMGGHWGVQGRLSNIGSKGYIDRADARLNSYFLQGGYFSDNTVVKFITFNGTEKTYMAWDYASKADMQKYGRRYNPSGKYTDENGKTAFYNNQTDNYHQQHYQLLWNQSVNNSLSLNAALHYTKGDGYYEQYKENQKLYKYLLSSGLGSKSNLIRQKRMDNDFYGAVASLNYDNRNGLTANVGGGWNKYDGDHYGKVVWVRNFSGDINPDHEYYRNNAIKTDMNVYGKLNYEFIKGMSAFVDLQYRHVGYE